MNRKSGQNTERNLDGTFAAGNSGKPKGTRHKVTRAIENLMEGQAEAVAQKAIDMALEGDTTALRLCLERIAPPKKDAAVSFNLPAMKSSRDAADTAQAVLRAVSLGEITPLEGTSIMRLIEGLRRALELSEYEGRLKALEQSVGARIS